MLIEDLNIETDLTDEETAKITGGAGNLPSPVEVAFRVGYAIGGAQDEEYGLSDAIAGTDDYPIITDEVKNAGKQPT